MNRAFELMLAEVHRYEGTVNQFLGDGIMALFGAPIAHEDHAQRAVHAALGIRAALAGYRAELQQARGIAFQVRQGLNTGLVVVGSIGSDLRMDYTAVGDTTNVAARLQQAATPGQVVDLRGDPARSSAATSRRGPLGRALAQGEERAGAGVGACWPRARRARGSRSRPSAGSRRSSGASASFSSCRSAFERAPSRTGPGGLRRGRAGHRQVAPAARVPAPIGDRARLARGPVPLLRALHGLPPARSICCGAASASRSRLGSGHRREDRAGRRRARRGTRRAAPYLRALLSVDPGDPAVARMSPQQRRGETFDALRRLLGRAARAGPQVVVIEDLHWIDAATEQFLASLVGQRRRACRVLLSSPTAPATPARSASGAYRHAHRLGQRCPTRTARGWPRTSSQPIRLARGRCAG